MNRTSIAWVRNPDGTQGFTWNPILGCKAVSHGCLHCYASRLASTRLAHLPDYAGLAHDGKWTGEVRFRPERLAEPLRHRKPASIFLDDMSDTFHEAVTNEQIAAIYGVMAACPQHTFFVLTKRAKRRREWFEWVKREVRGWWHAEHGLLWDHFMTICQIPDRDNDPEWTRMYQAAHGTEKATKLGDVGAAFRWPLPNVIEMSTVCTQEEADRDVPELLQTPATRRGLSVEPMLEAITLSHPDVSAWPETKPTHPTANPKEWDDWKYWMARDRGIQWVVVGGESGPKARPFRIEWASSIRDQCKAAGTAFFMKQMGANCQAEGRAEGQYKRVPFRDRAGADPSEWPADLRVREFPTEK